MPANPHLLKIYIGHRMSRAKVVLDPGHGGTKKIGGSSPNNAKGPTGLLEKTVTLQVGIEARDALLAAGVSVLLTRETDVNLGLAERAAIAKNAHADVFISIHLNDDSSPTVQGTETWLHTKGTPASRSLAYFVQDAVLTATGYRDRGVKSKNLGVLDPTKHMKKTACCLVELSFMSDPADEARLKEQSYQANLGAAIAKGARQYLLAFGKISSPCSSIVSESDTVVFEDAANLA